MWAARVDPDQAASNLSKWAKKLGVENPPEWLKTATAGRRTHRYAFCALLILIFAGGVFVGIQKQSILNAVNFWGSKEGDHAEPNITVRYTVFMPRKDDHLAGANVHFDVLMPAHGCGKGVLRAPIGQMDSRILDDNFQFLVRQLDARDPQKQCSVGYMPSGQDQFTTANVDPPEYFADQIEGEIKSGRRNLYVLYAWKYAYDDKPNDYYITEFCSFYESNFEVMRECQPQHIATYHHLNTTSGLN